MNRQQTVEALLEEGAVAVLRLDPPDQVLRVIEALMEGGLRSIEITMTVPHALEHIAGARRAFGKDLLLGVGSVVDVPTAYAAVEAGARYVISPIFKPEIVRAAHEQDVPALPGCFSPTEVQQAHEAGADIIKIFPADALGMPFFKALLAPLPHLKLMPTGGVSLTNAGDWLRHGACAVGVGSALLDKEAIATRNFSKLTANARLLMQSLAEGRR